MDNRDYEFWLRPLANGEEQLLPFPVSRFDVGGSANPIKCFREDMRARSLHGLSSFPWVDLGLMLAAGVKAGLPSSGTCAVPIG